MLPKRSLLTWTALVLMAGYGIAAQPTSAPAASAQASPQATPQTEAARRLLVHVHTGPENPTKAALAFLVAATALKRGHAVDLFLAGDGVRLLTAEAIGSVEGRGTGRLNAVGSSSSSPHGLAYP